MKIVLSVRSAVAYDLLVKHITLNESLFEDLQIQKRNAVTVQDLEDAIEFYQADLYIIDSKIEEYDALLELLNDRGCEYLTIEDKVKEVLPVLLERYGIEEEQEEEIYYEKEEKERVVIQEKIIEKEVIRTRYQAIPSKVVVVGSLYHGAGSTLLSVNIAKMIAERGIDVAYIEHPLIKPYMYDFLQIHRHEDDPYTDISRKIHASGSADPKAGSWIKDGVKWHVIDSKNPPLPSFSYENMLVYSHAVKANAIIVDISNRWLDPEIQKYIQNADEIVLCVEPDPIKYDWSLFDYQEHDSREKRTMDHLVNAHYNNLNIVMMKQVKGIDIKLIKEMLHKKPIAQMPYIPYQTIQQSIFNSKLLYDIPEYGDIFESKLIPLIAKIVPKDFVELESEGDGFFKNMLKFAKK